MAWRDQLRRAKLGGIEFLVDSSEAQIGRNTHLHEYPQRDKPFVEDLGRKARRLTLDAYVIGPDYMSTRDALIREIEKAGVKTLVHPYLGEMSVTIVDCTGPRESTREGGMARFNIAFVESGKQEFPAASTNTSNESRDAGEKGAASCLSAFNAKYVDTPQANHTLALHISDVTNKLQTLVANVTTVPTGVSDFIRSAKSLSGAVSNLILVPQALASNMVSLFFQLRDVVNAPKAALDVVREMFNYGSDLPAVPQNTANRVIEANNQDALVALVRQASVLAAASISADIQFDTRDDALALRDELSTVIDTQADTVATDDEYFALVDARTAVSNDLQTRGAQLARIQRITLPETTPALVLAHRRYGDASRENEIVARNAVRDPLFLPSGYELEVLTDE
jgi:prophage DNA circulation protein